MRVPLAPQLRRSHVRLGLALCPLISGLFLGAVAFVLVVGRGGAGRAFAIGALTGGIMFAANAVALWIAMLAMNDEHVP